MAAGNQGDFKYLGVTITPELSWKCHIDNITKKKQDGDVMPHANFRGGFWKIRIWMKRSLLLPILYQKTF